jgi:hypothetical protein
VARVLDEDAIELATWHAPRAASGRRRRVRPGLASEFAGGTVRREWPLLALGEHGSVVSGTADLVVETAYGAWVIDHKSDQVVDPQASFVGYLPQLEAYAQALEKQGRAVSGVAIHWMRRGEGDAAASDDTQAVRLDKDKK